MRIGVFVCHCGLNIAANVDVKAVAEYAKTLPNVVVSEDYVYMCSDPGQDLIKERMKEFELDHVVVASCSPRMHENTFRKVVSEGGINAFLYEQANIRENCSWVHEDREKATEKAKALVAAAVAKASLLKPLEVMEADVEPSALIIGGGITGIQAAIDSANAGYKTYLLERDPSIGGHVAEFCRIFPDMDRAACLLVPKMTEVLTHPNITLLAYSELVDVGGFIGNFDVKIRKKPRYVDPAKCTACGECAKVCPVKTDDGKAAIEMPYPFAVPRTYTINPELCLRFQGEDCTKCKDVCPEGAVDFEEKEVEEEIRIGAIVVATGYDEFDASLKPELRYDMYDNVITGVEFEKILLEAEKTGELKVNGKEPRDVIFIQCVGSRDKNVGNEYCSRVCCMYTAKQATMVKDLVPDSNVTVCYIDVRAYGRGYEQFYENAQKKGVRYWRGNAAEVYKENGKLVVRAENTMLGDPKELSADLVVLATGMTPKSDARDIGNLLKVPQSADRFFLEAHPKLGPVDTASDGVYIAGTCQGPKDIADSLSQASGAVMKALIPLCQGKVLIEPITSVVNEEICSGCRMCEKICVYDAPTFDEERGVMTINSVVCKGCGSCGSTCPSSAISMNHFRDQQIFAQINMLST